MSLERSPWILRVKAASVVSAVTRPNDRLETCGIPPRIWDVRSGGRDHVVGQAEVAFLGVRCRVPATPSACRPLLGEDLGLADTDRERVRNEIELDSPGLSAAGPGDNPVAGGRDLVRLIRWVCRHLLVAVPTGG